MKLRLLKSNFSAVKKKALFNVAPKCSLHEKTIFDNYVITVDLSKEFKNMKCNSFGEKLRRFRTLHGMTQEDVAKAIGSSKANISKYELDKSYPSKNIKLQLLILFNSMLT